MMHKSDYKDPLDVLLTRESWKEGCRGCHGSVYSLKDRKYICDVKQAGHPNMGKDTCQFWRGKYNKS